MEIKDNSTTPISCFVDVVTITNKIANKTFQQLEKEGVIVFPMRDERPQDIDAKQMVLQAQDDNYVTHNVMGFLGCGPEELSIKSRFDRTDQDYFLQYMLHQVFEVPNTVNLQISADHADGWFNLLIFLFPRYLKQALRKGLYRTYIRYEYNDTNVKGPIDLARQIKTNIPFAGKIAYHQREYSADNDLIELIRHTIELIKVQPFGGRLLTYVKNEVNVIVAATPKFKFFDRQKIIAKNQQNPVRHAYYYEYRTLQQLCLLILQHRKHQIRSGPQAVYGLLFDGAWLWEEYVNTLVKNSFWHPRNKSGTGRQWLFKNLNTNHVKGEIYPDFIGRNREHRVIADAKYKLNERIGNQDYLQLLAYMLRFDARTAYYFYPETSSGDDEVLYICQGNSYENNVTIRSDIRVIKHGLKIPSAAVSYQDFAAQMQISEITFVQELAKNQGLSLL